MNAGKEVIRQVLSEALLRGALKDLAEYLESQTRNLPDLPGRGELGDPVREAEDQFLDTYRIWAVQKKSLTRPDQINSFAEYVRLYLGVHDVTTTAVGLESGVGEETVQRVLGDASSLLDLPMHSIATLARFIGLSLQSAMSLVEKSIRLSLLSRLQTEGMARYKSAGMEQDKLRSLRKAQEELLLKASSRKKFSIETSAVEVERRIKERLAELAEAYAHDGKR